MGDSITFGVGQAGTSGNGYRKALQDRLTANATGNVVDYVGTMHSGSMADTDHEGHPGWVIGQIDAAEDTAIAAKPNVVLLHAGTNDVDRGIDVDGAPQRLAHLVDDMLAHDPGVVVVVALILPIKDAAKQAKVVQYNSGVRAAMEQRRQAGQKVVLAPMDGVPVGLLADSLHPSDAGYAAMADVWYDALQQAAGMITAPVQGAPRCVDGGRQGWFDRGVYASGVAPAANVRLADFDGDGRDDYLVVHDDGSVDAYRNVGGDAPGQAGFVALGRVASGIGVPGWRVRFADIDGDGRADYLAVGDTGAVTAYLNKGGWIAMGQIAAGVPGATPGTVRFADLNGDGRDDYLVVAPNGGPVTAYYNNGGDSPGHPGWIAGGQVATGTGEAPVLFGNADCDGRSDYLIVNAATGAVKAYLYTGSGWNFRGQIAGGGGAGQVAFADLNGDGRDDYVLLDPATGAMHAYFNNGGDA
ncbi:FG-GAP-like repeat-containing protein [Dactylosporangium salmoneum]